MCIVINDGKSIDFAFVLEAAVGAVEHGKTVTGFCEGDAKLHGGSQGSQCIRDIVKSWYVKGNGALFFAMANQLEGSTALFVIGNIFCRIIFRTGQTVVDNTGFYVFCNFFRMCNFTVQN